MGDNVNPKRESSGVQFYIVQGRVFNDKSLDSVETYRLNGRKIPADQREIYKTVGGAPHLDQTYTIFGELVYGFDVLDKIAQTKTSGRQGGDKPLSDIRIRKVKMIRRYR
jgi:peptidyl-prolyl cis-trans isomerase B (cyclophilin B)